VSRRPKQKPEELDYDQFRSRAKERRLDSLYLLVGDEQYLHDRALRLLYGTVDEASRSFNISVLSVGADAGNGQQVTAAMVVDAANQYPMMSDRRIVVVRDFEKLNEDQADPLIEYLKRPAPTTVMAFQAASVDKRRKLTAALMKTCTVVSLDRLSDRRLVGWADRYLRQLGCTIERNALGQLIGLIGNDMSRLARELDKLAAYSGGGMINSEAVGNLVGRAREHRSWDLWDAIVERDRKKALRLTARLLDDGSDPLALVGSLAGLYRRMLKAKELMARGASSEEVGKATGQYGQRGASFNARVLRTSREEIVHGLRRLAQVDNAIKNSEATARLQVEYLVAELTLPESYRWSIFG
jgi:DNA polymerase-3 subunit delta